MAERVTVTHQWPSYDFGNCSKNFQVSMCPPIFASYIVEAKQGIDFVKDTLEPFRQIFRTVVNVLWFIIYQQPQSQRAISNRCG